MSFNLNSQVNIICNSKLDLLSADNNNYKKINDLTLQENDTIIYNNGDFSTIPYNGITINPNTITASDSTPISNNYIVYKIDPSNNIEGLTIKLPPATILTKKFIFHNITNSTNPIRIECIDNSSDRINNVVLPAIFMNEAYATRSIICYEQNRWIRLL